MPHMFSDQRQMKCLIQFPIPLMLLILSQEHSFIIISMPVSRTGIELQQTNYIMLSINYPK